MTKSQNNSRYTGKHKTRKKEEGLILKKTFYDRIKFKIANNSVKQYNRNHRIKKFEKLNKTRLESGFNEIKLKFVWGNNDIPKDYIPIGIFPKGQIACIHQDTRGSVHEELAEILFPDYKNPVIKAIESSYTMVLPYKSMITLCYGNEQLSAEQKEKQEKAIQKIKKRYQRQIANSETTIEMDTINVEDLKLLQPNALKEEKII